MALEIATILLGLCVGAVAVLYAAPRGYMGHKRIKSSIVVAPVKAYTPPPPPVVEAKPAAAPAPVQSAAPAPTPSPSPAIYETVQPAPAPVTYASPSSTSFGSPTITRKPTRTYRRRSAPVRSTSASRPTKNKQKKR